MISPADRNRSLPGCRWSLFVKRSDFIRMNPWTRTLCIRIPEAPRIVTEKDCLGCALWEPADMRENRRRGADVERPMAQTDIRPSPCEENDDERDHALFRR